MNENLKLRMQSCSIVNGYDGLDLLIDFAKQNPADASQIVWDVLTNRGDPGKDDYALCEELVNLLGAAMPRAKFESRVADYWEQGNQEIRRNLLSGVATGAFSIQFIRSLFFAPGSDTAIRHMIVAALASSRFKECRDLIAELAQNIGEYLDDPNKQEVLKSFQTDLHDALAT